MMQKVLATTVVGCRQVENDSSIVVGGATCRKRTTVGCDCYTVPIGSMRRWRG